MIVGESIVHRELCQNIVDWVENRFGQDVLSFIDSSVSAKNEAPERIFGYVPDYMAHDLFKREFMIIGEAKPRYDLESAHTRAQLVAYLKYLKYFSNPLLIFATEVNGMNLSKAIITDCMLELSIDNVKAIVLNRDLEVKV